MPEAGGYLPGHNPAEAVALPSLPPTRRSDVLLIVVAVHCDMLPLYKVVQLAQAASTYHRLTAKRLLALRALKVVLSRRPGAMFSPTLGAMATGSRYTCALASAFFSLYKHYSTLQTRQLDLVAHIAGSLDGDNLSTEGETNG